MGEGSRLSDRNTPNQIARLEACVASDPGASEFPALAEALRRAGRLPEAEEVARKGLERKPGSLEGALLLALTLIDQGRIEPARDVLADCASQCLAEDRLPAGAVLADSATLEDVAAEFGDDVTEGELESAFDAAEPVLDELVDANRVAEEAMRGADLDEPEDFAGVAEDPVFATRTMAELLERQGDSQAASRIRANLDAREESETAIPSNDMDERERTIATLESWLANLRSGAR
jgi:thioredoxin-like negative regulator of GroEL